MTRRGIREDEESPPRDWRRIVEQLAVQSRDELVVLVFGTIAALVRAMGVKVESGQTGLLFSFGRARRELHPGFHLLIPFVQRARKMPTRSRTLDLPAQRVVNVDGLVYHVDANLVYRVTDVRKAMIEIDHLEKGMLQMLGLGVQDVLRSAGRQDLLSSENLDRALATDLARRLAPWGVEVERAGFPSISPSPQTLRITQLGNVAQQRRASRDWLVEGGLHARRALSLVGTRRIPKVKFKHLVRVEEHRRRLRRLKAAAKRGGWTAVEIKQASLAMRSRVSVRGRSRARLKL